jgi:hypothetical protein
VAKSSTAECKKSGKSSLIAQIISNLQESAPVPPDLPFFIIGILVLPA